MNIQKFAQAIHQRVQGEITSLPDGMMLTYAGDDYDACITILERDGRYSISASATPNDSDIGEVKMTTSDAYPDSSLEEVVDRVIDYLAPAAGLDMGEFGHRWLRDLYQTLQAAKTNQ